MNKFSDKYLEHISHRLTHYRPRRENNGAIELDITQEEQLNYQKEFSIRKEATLKMLLTTLNQMELSHQFIKELHVGLKGMESHIAGIGEYKKEPNFILGRNKKLTPPEKVYEEMEKWIQEQNTFIYDDLSEEEVVSHIAKASIKFVNIHPFDDGNGAVVRLLNVYLSYKKGLLPIVFLIGDKKITNELINQNNFTGIADYMRAMLKKEELIFNKLNKVK